MADQGNSKEVFYFTDGWISPLWKNIIFHRLENALKNCYSLGLEDGAYFCTFVSIHAFYASRKAWLKRARAGVDIDDAINYATKYTTEMKAKFSYCDQIKFNEPVHKPGIPEWQLKN